jgi:hypothetical protein
VRPLSGVHLNPREQQERRLSAVYGSIGVVRRQLCPIVGGLVAIAGSVIAVARGQVAIVCGLFAVQLRPSTVAPCPARGLLRASGSVAEVGEAVASVRREIVLGGRSVASGRRSVASSRRGVALGGRGVAIGRRAVARLPDSPSLVGGLVTGAARVTARLSAAFIGGLGCGPVIVAVRVVAISRHLVAISRGLVAI